MSNYQLSLNYGPWQQRDADHQALFIVASATSIRAKLASDGDALYTNSQRASTIEFDKSTMLLCFSLQRADNNISDSNNSDSCLMSRQFELEPGTAIFRLDQVTFPAKAIAWRHTHPGPGIRYLLEGELELVADDHVKTMHAGDAWFEDANQPVCATASANAARTVFVRAMVLPVRFEGQRSINVLDPEDRQRPAKQSNHRFFDQRIHID